MEILAVLTKDIGDRFHRNRTFPLYVRNANNIPDSSNCRNKPPPDLEATDLISQFPKEEQEGEFDRPETRVEQNIERHDERLEMLPILKGLGIKWLLGVYSCVELVDQSQIVLPQDSDGQ